MPVFELGINRMEFFPDGMSEDGTCDGCRYRAAADPCDCRDAKLYRPSFPGGTGNKRSYSVLEASDDRISSVATAELYVDICRYAVPYVLNRGVPNL